MIKKLTCIDCPVGCSLLVDIEGSKVVKVSGNKCPKGELYASSEIENPVRILTSTVSAKGLSSKMIPVRTDRAIPKAKIFKAMEAIKRVTVDKPVRPGNIIVHDIAASGANLIATGSAS